MMGKSSLWHRIKQKILWRTHPETAKEAVLLEIIEKRGWSIDSGISDYFILQKGNIKCKLRKNSSDIKVFLQVFIEKEYASLPDFFYNNGLKASHIIDAGSNIGLTTLFLHEHFPEATYYCIEPDNSNLILLEENLSSPNFKKKIYPKALWKNNDNVFLDDNFRDGKEWSRQTLPQMNNQVSSEKEIESITLNDIIQENDIPVISILKMDIEGAEKYIFEPENDFSYLNKTMIIAIEIHPEIIAPNIIKQILKKHDFYILDLGETTFGFNLKFMSE